MAIFDDEYEAMRGEIRRLHGVCRSLEDELNAYKQGKRTNAGYDIIDSCKVGDSEVVIGYNPNKPCPYVCWRCDGGNNYYWGRYCGSRQGAQYIMINRAASLCGLEKDGVNLSPDEAETVRAYIEGSKDFRIANYDKWHTAAYGKNVDIDAPPVDFEALDVLNHVQKQNQLIDDIAKKLSNQLYVSNKDKSEGGSAR